jgi:hypothetical protein
VGPTASSFCAACGTTLIFAPAGFPDIVGIAGGCFLGDSLGEPTASASDDRRCSWLRLPESLVVRTSTAAGDRSMLTA